MPKQGYGSTRAPRGPYRVGESKKRKGRLVGTKKGSKQEFGATRAPRGPHKVGEAGKKSRKQKIRLGNAKYKMGQ